MRQESLFGSASSAEAGSKPARGPAGGWEAEWAAAGTAPLLPEPAAAPGLPSAPGSAVAPLDALLDRFTDLADLAEAARGCRACGLRDGCKGVVFGEGDPRATLMLVGEGPGATEDELGRPFVGRAGELLDRILAAAGFRRQDVYITNVVMCRPPGNRVPTDAEMAACLPYLRAKMRLVRPALVVALGSTATRALVHPRARITQVRGTWHRYGGALVLPTYHPAALLRDPGKKRPVWEDFKKVRDAHRRLEEAGPEAFAALADELCREGAPSGA